MQSEQNGTITCLQEIYKNTCDGAGAIAAILPHVGDEQLQKDLEQELHALRGIQMRAGRSLGALGKTPKGPIPIQRVGMKLGIAMRTMQRTDSGHIAKLMVHGNEMGINELRRTVATYPSLDGDTRALADELLQLELSSQQTMQRYVTARPDARRE